MFLEDLADMVGMFFPHIFNSKIINYKEKLDWILGVFP